MVRQVSKPKEAVKKENVPDIPVEIHVGPMPLNQPSGPTRLPLDARPGEQMII